MTELARHFGVSTYRIRRIRDAGLVHFRRSNKFGFEAWVARPRDFLDAPLYEPYRVARYVGVKSARTIRRWCQSGEIELTRLPHRKRLYASPRQMDEIKRFAQSRERRKRKENPRRLLEELGELARRQPPPDRSRSSDVGRRRR